MITIYIYIYLIILYILQYTEYTASDICIYMCIYIYVYRREEGLCGAAFSREIVSFRSCVRAGGRASAREISRYLEGFARWRFLLSSALLSSCCPAVVFSKWERFRSSFLQNSTVLHKAKNLQR